MCNGALGTNIYIDKKYDMCIIIIMYKYNNLSILIILKCSVIVYTLYMLIVLFSNIFLKETSGEIISFNKYIDKIIVEPSRGSGGGSIRNDKGYIEKDIWRIDLLYKYTVNDITYSNSRISNVLIFPNIEYIKGDPITVYYNKLFPKYSLVFKCNYIYFIINLFPIIILCIIILLIHKKNNKKVGKMHNCT